ncbi:hypothetical protein PybrP1_011256 [[Pythium] brassicae (nom. inval.)]|nr:hypothetical protein PybrP1_011256 [[Pythium] brassicae (nom. inval.)]
MNMQPVIVRTAGGVPAPPPSSSKMDFNPFESPSMNAQQFPDEKTTHDTLELDMNSSRFVAGDQFYNHEMYGSLRKGGEVNLFTKRFIGLIAGTCSSVISYSALQGCLKPVMQTQLGLTLAEKTAVERLIEMPMLLSFVIGLIADCYPIRGTRRKSYMIIGVLMNAFGVLGLAALTAHFESLEVRERKTPLVVLAIITITIASFGCLITYLCVHTRTIELSQQESLRRRGAIQVSYLIVRRVAGYVATAYTQLVIGNDPTNPKLSVYKSMLVLVAICVAPLPLIMRYWYEETYSLATTMGTRARIFWKVIQQKAVWRTLAFICCYTLFLTIKFFNSMAVVKSWTGITGESVMGQRTALETVIFGVILVWRFFFMNRPWRTFFAIAPFFQIVPWVFLAVFVCRNIMRSVYFYYVVIYLSYIADGVMAFVNLVPLTEIIQEGSEGVTVGLVLTLQRVIGIFVNTNSNGLFKGANFYSLDGAKKDTNDARWDVLVSLLLNYGINALALVGLIFLPNQKLDAQQLRMYGGFTKGATVVIISFVVAFVLYSLSVNIMLLNSAWSCYRIAGGNGCS